MDFFIPPYSVVIPVYNNLTELERALRSVLAQTLPAAEIIICNDASDHPGTANIINSFCATHHGIFKSITHSFNQGPANSRNSGILAATSPLIAFLDADDEWLPMKMEEQIKLFFYDDVVACGCCVDSGMYKSLEGRILITLTKQELLYKNYIQPSSLVVRKQAVLDVGLFNQSQRYAEEGDLYLRLASYGSIVFLSKLLVAYNTRAMILGGSSNGIRLSNKILKMYAGNLTNLELASARGDITLLEFYWHSVLLIIRLVVYRVRSLFPKSLS